MKTEQRWSAAFDYDMWHTTDDRRECATAFVNERTHRTSSTDVPSKKRVKSKRSTCAVIDPTDYSDHRCYR